MEWGAFDVGNINDIYNVCCSENKRTLIVYTIFRFIPSRYSEVFAREKELIEISNEEGNDENGEDRSEDDQFIAHSNDSRFGEEEPEKSDAYVEPGAKKDYCVCEWATVSEERSDERKIIICSGGRYTGCCCRFAPALRPRPVLPKITKIKFN